MQLLISVIDHDVTERHEEILIPVQESKGGSDGILYKNPNCAIVGKGERDDIGLFIDNDVDDSGRNIVLIKTERNSYAILPNLIKRTDIITFGDKVKVKQSDGNYLNGDICDYERYFFGTGNTNYASVNIITDGGYILYGEWVKISDIERLYTDVLFKSTTVQILNQIKEDFTKKGVFPTEEYVFWQHHLPTSLHKAVRTMQRANDTGKEYLAKEFESTFDEMEALDEQIAKTLLSYIMTNGNIFDPQTAYGVLLYNALNNLGVFDMTNTELEYADDCVISVFRNRDSLFVYQDQYANKFFYEIMFGESKNIIKFALWKDYKTEKIDELYGFLEFLDWTKERKIKNTPNTVRFPEYNEKIGNLYLLQLKALSNAI